jgi:hypothetical protein
MKLVIKEITKKEICHYASSDMLITSHFNKVYVNKNNDKYKFSLPGGGIFKIFGNFRLFRRALRLDKCNVVPVQDGLVIVRQGKLYFYNELDESLTPVLTLKNCRNVLHQSITVIDGQELFFGEYGNNASRNEVPVYRSRNGGKSWETVFVFPAGKIKHVHGCYYDPYEDKIWTLTGDFEGECYMLCSDKDFKNVEWIGDGSQQFRACNVFFEKNAVHWIMDSQLQDSYHVQFDRKTRKIKLGQQFPGPVWFIKRLMDGYFLAATAQEIGPGVRDEYVHFMVSKNLKDWIDVHLFEHDHLPKRYFKFGVIGFPDGLQTSDDFYFFAEALQGFDGKMASCKIIE